MEEVVFRHGAATACGFDLHPVLAWDRMPRVHARIVESGAPMGGIGVPGPPCVPPAVANAVAALTGQRLRSPPFARTRPGTV